MKTISMANKVALLLLLLAGCGGLPTHTAQLDQTRGEFMAAQNNPQVGAYAAQEMKLATEAMDKANAAAAKRQSVDEVDQLAYVARQKIATAAEVARQKAAEAQLAAARQQREQLQLQQRAAETEQARQAAAAAMARASDAQQHAAQLSAQLAELSARKTERGIVVTIGDLLFDVDRAELTDYGMRTARKLAEVLQDNPQRTVQIEGYTDSTGTAAHNQALSERRADAVRDALVAAGVASERITTRGFGSSFAVASNTTASNRQLNRRVEIVLSDDSGRIRAR